MDAAFYAQIKTFWKEVKWHDITFSADSTEDHDCHWKLNLHDSGHTLGWDNKPPVVLGEYLHALAGTTACLGLVGVSTCWSAWCAWVAFPALPWTEIVLPSSFMKSCISSHALPAWVFHPHLCPLHWHTKDILGSLIMISWSSATNSGIIVASDNHGFSSLLLPCNWTLNVPVPFWPLPPSILLMLRKSEIS